MKKLAILVAAVLLLAGTGLAQRKSHESIVLTTPDASRAVYLKATADRGLFDPNGQTPPKEKGQAFSIESFSVDVWADPAGLGMEGADPFAFQVVVDLVSGAKDVPIGEIIMENKVGSLGYYVRHGVLGRPLPGKQRPDLGIQDPNEPAPYSIKAVRLMCNGEVMAEGSF